MAKPAKTETPADVLVVDDVREHAEAMVEGLARAGHRCEPAVSGPEAIDKLQRKHFDVIVTDLVLGGAVDGLAVLRAAKEQSADTQVVIISAHGNIPTAVEAVKRGAFNFLEKPIDLDLLRAMVNRAAAGAVGKRESKEPTLGKGAFEGIVGTGPAISAVLATVRKIGPTNIPVLVTGPNGAGKELIARAIHKCSPRAGKRFVAINCAGIPETLLEDELFGHVRGGYTGAQSDREGCFEYADGGTLFLDEIGDMPVAMQAKLLRVLETGEVKRLGSNEPVKIDVRVVSATNRDLEEFIDKQRFREDLYFRLKGTEIRVPSLAERREDIRALVDHFRAEAARSEHKTIKGVAEEVYEALQRHDWPGNVRELRSAVRVMTALCEGDTLTAADLPPELRGPSDGSGATEAGSTGGSASLRDMERDAIRNTLEKVEGNRAKAARLLGMGERTLYRKLKEYGLG